ncbi:hypothetical protein cypCar_00031847 [Cyprinus carpio]|nr:hypothetical protein cypCar_00031847 [Cyprinus carpio]
MHLPHAMILVVPIDTSFKNELKRIITEYMVTFGEDVWKHTIVLFMWGDRFPDISIEQHIDSEDLHEKVLGWLQRCDEYSSIGYGTSSNISNLEDPEPRDKT